MTNYQCKHGFNTATQFCVFCAHERERTVCEPDEPVKDNLLERVADIFSKKYSTRHRVIGEVIAETKEDAQAIIDLIRAEDGWVSVETPPKEDGHYWCYFGNGNHGFNRQMNIPYCAEQNVWHAGNEMPTHWMNEPEPPRRDK